MGRAKIIYKKGKEDINNLIDPTFIIYLLVIHNRKNINCKDQ